MILFLRQVVSEFWEALKAHIIRSLKFGVPTELNWYLNGWPLVAMLAVPYLQLTGKQPPAWIQKRIIIPAKEQGQQD